MTTPNESATSSLSPSDKLMLEVIANTEELISYAIERIEQPPRGSMDEVGHYRTLNALKLNAKQRDALRILMEELAFNVAVTLFAVIDNEVETDLENFPQLALINRTTNQPIANEPLHQEFERLWNEGAHEQVDLDE